MMVGVTIGTIITQVIEAFRRYRNTSIRIEVPGVMGGSKIAVETATAETAEAIIQQAMGTTDRDMAGRRRNWTKVATITTPDGHAGRADHSCSIDS
jgi:hypothetical protein